MRRYGKNNSVAECDKHSSLEWQSAVASNFATTTVIALRSDIAARLDE